MEGKMDKNHSEVLPKIETYLVPADVRAVLCIDEREHEQNVDAHHYAPENRYGINLPGAVFGVVDAVKKFRKVSEEGAWEIVKQAGIPLWGHDDGYHEEYGCGYERLVEEHPEAMLATEPVSAKDRMARLRKLGGKVLRYLGQHDHTGSVINRRSGMTINQTAAAKDGIRVFACDSWIAEVWGPKLGIDSQKLMEHWENVHNSTVRTLTEKSTKPIESAQVIA